MPTLFGRATAIYGEHAELHGSVNELRALCVALKGGRPTTKLDARSALEHFLRRLRRHFAREESDGYFGTVVASVPDLNVDIAWLQAEHGEIIETMLELLRMCEYADGQRLAGALERTLEAFEAHERRETELIQHFLQSDKAAVAE
jgi:hemerythrin-like domain-containing protein